MENSKILSLVCFLYFVCSIRGTPVQEECNEVPCVDDPYNRTCTRYNKGMCCAAYYCGPNQGDANRHDDECDVKSCSPPPKGEYTSFQDPYSCCFQYQTKKDEKAGKCPTPKKKTQSSTIKGADSVATRTLQCVGDFNCKGTMKCCKDGRVYAHCIFPDSGSSGDSDETSSEELSAYENFEQDLADMMLVLSSGNETAHKEIKKNLKGKKSKSGKNAASLPVSFIQSRNLLLQVGSLAAYCLFYKFVL